MRDFDIGDVSGPTVASRISVEWGRYDRLSLALQPCRACLPFVTNSFSNVEINIH